MTDEAQEIQRIRTTVQLYFDGMHNGDTDKLSRAFHPGAVLTGYFRGNLTILPLNQWLDMLKAGPSPASRGEVYDMKLVSLDITENAAVVKVRDLYQGLWFTDYLSLLKINDEWVIVHKTFHHEPKQG